MVPSHTVENYLKAIFQAQIALVEPDGLVPMGHLASALGVVPGTATTMVKALADSGLARYEPYAGVRLTAAGEKLAALVLRRHRLVELFLVKVMGMSWTEVHDEAENLEHAVSDRLIDRIDEMLGRPAVDPHGDPIPDPEGTVPMPEYDSLLTCPLGAAVTISRVSDQDREFLQFAERHELRPGDVVRVEERNAAGDSVLLRGRNDRRVTIGARAASKVLVQTAKAIVCFLLLSRLGFAQAPAPAVPSTEPFKISDNSFLVEEAFNQEAGVFQNIFGAVRVQGEWAAAFTQEWPIGVQAHQFSYTVPWLDAGSHRGVGDVLINYRYQAALEGPGHPAFSPRLSLILPTGRTSRGLGSGSAGLQINLPFSKRTGDWYWHWNAGTTWLPRAEGHFEQAGGPTMTRRDALVSPFLAASAIYRTHPMFHLMVESVISFDESVTPQRTNRDTTYTVSPGFRGGWNVGDKQIIVGFAVPISRSGDTSDTGALFYFSYELPFAR
jgi:DtxR family transcriptional regulator, Mn-dependent transcriptional regulator